MRADKVENGASFKINTEYYFELLRSKTRKLL